MENKAERGAIIIPAGRGVRYSINRNWHLEASSLEDDRISDDDGSVGGGGKGNNKDMNDIDLEKLDYQFAMASAFHEAGKFAEAKTLLRKVLGSYNKLRGRDLNVAATYNNLGVLARKENQYKEAEAYHQKALRLRMEKLGENHVDVADTYNNLGAVCHNQNMHEKARD